MAKKRRLKAPEHGGKQGRLADIGQRIGESNQLRKERRAYDRDKKDERKQTKREAAGSDGDDRAKLKLATVREDRLFRRAVRKSGITSEGTTQAERNGILRGLHQKYVTGVVRRGMAPFRHVVNARNMLATMGMRASMWLASPKFRPYVENYADQMVDAINRELNGQEDRQTGNPGGGPEFRGQGAGATDGPGPGREGVPGGADRPGPGRERVAGAGAETGQEQAEAAGSTTGTGQRRGNRIGRLRGLLSETLRRGLRTREPFTEHSAALARVGIAQSAYDEMRRPGADREKIKQNYENTLRALDERIQADGLDRAVVDRNMRVIVGELMERDPAEAAVFSELAHGRLAKSDPQTVVIPGASQTTQLWNGDYVDAYGDTTKSEGPFTLRDPMTPEEHQSAMAETMYGELAKAKNPEEFGETMRQYIIGSATREYPEMVEMTDDPEGRVRMDRSRAMFASMSADRLGDEEQRVAYLKGFEEAFQNLERTHPEKMRQFQQSLGHEWGRETERLAEEYRNFGKEAAREREREQGEPDRSEPERATPSEPDGDRTVDAEEAVEDHSESKNDWRGSPPETHRRGPAPESAAEVLVAGLPVADDENKRQAEQIEKMSDAIATDILDSVQADNAGNPAQRALHSMQAWRNKSGTLAVLDPRNAQLRELLQNQDKDVDARVRRLQDVEASMVSFDPHTHDGLYAMAYVRSLEKVVAAQPACEGVVHKMVIKESGDLKNWREHEYQAAMRCGYSGQDQTTHQQQLDRIGLEPVASHPRPEAETPQRQGPALDEAGRNESPKDPAQVGADLGRLASQGKPGKPSNEVRNDVKGPGYGD